MQTMFTTRKLFSPNVCQLFVKLCDVTMLISTFQFLYFFYCQLNSETFSCKEKNFIVKTAILSSNSVILVNFSLLSYIKIKLLLDSTLVQISSSSVVLKSLWCRCFDNINTILFRVQIRYRMYCRLTNGGSYRQCPSLSFLEVNFFLNE